MVVTQSRKVLICLQGSHLLVFSCCRQCCRLTLLQTVCSKVRLAQELASHFETPSFRVFLIFYFTNFLHKWRKDAKHSKITLQENNDKNWNKQFEKNKNIPAPAPRFWLLPNLPDLVVVIVERLCDFLQYICKCIVKCARAYLPSQCHQTSIDNAGNYSVFLLIVCLLLCGSFCRYIFSIKTP